MRDQQSSNWTHLKVLLTLSIPIALSQLAQLATGVADIVMAGRLGAISLGAISTGAAVWTPMMIFLLGLLYGLTHSIGRLRGQGQQQDLSELVLIGVITGLIGGAMLGALLFIIAEPLFTVMSITPELVTLATSYCKIVAFAFPGLGIFLALRFTLEASNGAFWVTITVLSSIILKVMLNGILVFGWFGITPMGVDGFGVSTVIVFWAMATMLLLMIVPRKAYRDLIPCFNSFSRLSLRQVVTFAWNNIPIALNFLSDYLVMAVVALFIASIGPVAISSHQITFNIVSILLMLTTAVGMAGTIVLSTVSGESYATQVKSNVKLILSASLSLAMILSITLFFFGHQFANLYTGNSEILSQAAPLIRFVAVFFTLNVVAITLGFILRGLGQPQIPFGVMLFAHWGVSIPLGYILASTALITAPLGIIGWWYGLFTGVAVATIMLMFFVQRNLTTTGTN